MGNRLTNKDWTIQEVLYISTQAYGGKVDNKMSRKDVDVTGGRMTLKSNLKWDQTTKSWQQVGRDVKIVFKIKSQPISYHKTDTLKNHYFPVTFLIHNWELNFNSAFRWRTGSNFKWKNNKQKISEGKTPAEKDRIRADNLKTTNLNIKRGLQGQFIFELMWVSRKEGTLFGPMTCLNRSPKITNPSMIIFFDKHALYCVMHLLPKMFANENIRKFVKNEPLESTMELM
jgi:hypothetical protein